MMLHRKIYHAVTGAEMDRTIYDRISAGRSFLDGVVLTEQEVVFSKGVRRICMPFADVLWAYRRVVESHTTLGCCGGVLQDFRVVMRHPSGCEVSVSFEREANAIAVLEEISRRCPEAAIGYTEENKLRFITA